MIEYNPFSLKNKKILITGASSGIGRATAIECSKLGATVIITARNEIRLNETFSFLQGQGHSSIVADLTNSDDLSTLINSLPILDGCVNNAGISGTIPIPFITKSALMNIFEINTFSPILLTQQIVKQKKIAKGGSIVFTSSIAGVYHPLMGASLYSATKGAINGFFKGAALELASKQIRVNAVTPGMIETKLITEGAITDEQLDQDKLNYPLKRYGKPEDVAYAIIYLLSDVSQWVTGSNLLIDGGVTLQ